MKVKPKLVVKLKGGYGSGHYGHSGRPGKVGGSAPGSGGKVSVNPSGAAKAIGVKKSEVSAAMAVMYNEGMIDDQKAKAMYYGVKDPRDMSEREKKWHQEFGEQNKGSRVYLLFEGVNPDKPTHEVVITSFGGTKSFLEDNSWTLPKFAKTNVWRDPEPGDLFQAGNAIGGIEFYDPIADKKFWVEKMPGGDWVGGN